MSEKISRKIQDCIRAIAILGYGWNTSYFITICIHEKNHYFGEIRDGKMILNESGKQTEKLWGEIPERFPFARLDAFVVMPNHMHGIIIIDKPITRITTIIPTMKIRFKTGISKNANQMVVLQGIKIRPL